jgi:hypothetical protein
MSVLASHDPVIHFMISPSRSYLVVSWMLSFDEGDTFMRDNPRPTTLEVVEKRFNELTAHPNPLTMDGQAIGQGLPERAIPLDELRIILLKRQTPWHVKDAVWVELVRRAQELAEPWITATVGMAMPALKRIAGDTARSFRGDIADFDSEIVEGFLSALHRADPSAPGLYRSLYFAARRYGLEARSDADRTAGHSTCYDEAAFARYRPRVAGHPDLVLAKAVRDRRLSDEEAGLIIRAHLDGTGTSELAVQHGISPYQFRQMLARADHRLLRFLSDTVPQPTM